MQSFESGLPNSEAIEKNKKPIFSNRHSWNMFADPYRVNSIFYVNIHFKDNKEIMQEVFNPYKGRFLDKKICIRDVKFVETIDQIYLVQEYVVLSDFYLKKDIPTKTKFLYGWPNNDIDKFNK